VSTAVRTTLRVQVKPNARTSSFDRQPDGTWRARVQAPPTEGKANEALIELVAAHFGVTKVQVTIRSGAGARHKTIVIDGG
jgi:uncharacterized protein (TIGR00251 family)